jgi:stage II sporulation protein GA (sporulation sigma-E factor processing peptidase)
VGAVYAGICLLPGFFFLGNLFWRLVFLLIMVAIAYGVSKSALRRGAVFIFLSLALGGAAYGMGNGGFVGILCAGGMVFLLCGFGLRRPVGSATYIPVELTHNGKHLSITALQDTGNTLRDPITGTQVLIVGPDVAQRLIGLTPRQLSTPVESMGLLPGLRLIPYRTVGKPTGMLLGLKLQNVKIGQKEGSTLVAFAPERIGADGAYQALTGGLE